MHNGIKIIHYRWLGAYVPAIVSCCFFACAAHAEPRYYHYPSPDDSTVSGLPDQSPPAASTDQGNPVQVKQAASPAPAPGTSGVSAEEERILATSSYPSLAAMREKAIAESPAPIENMPAQAAPSSNLAQNAAVMNTSMATPPPAASVPLPVPAPMVAVIAPAQPLPQQVSNIQVATAVPAPFASAAAASPTSAQPTLRPPDVAIATAEPRAAASQKNLTAISPAAGEMPAPSLPPLPVQNIPAAPSLAPLPSTAALPVSTTTNVTAGVATGSIPSLSTLPAVAVQAPPSLPTLPPASAQAVLPPAEETEKLSRQSKHIAESLPAEKNTSQVHKPPVTMEHFHKNALEDDTEVKKHDGIGITISVRRPKANISHMLEDAYDALIAGNQEDAINLYKAVLEQQPSNKLALFGLATTYHRAGQLQLARPLYGKLLAIDPHNMEGLNNFLVLLADEAPEDALNELKKLEDNHPSFSPIPAQMAIIYEKTKQYGLATQYMNHAIELSPENLKYRYDMAVMLDKQGAWSDAAQFYQQLLNAEERGEKIPANSEEIQERLTFIRSNKPKGTS